MRNKRILISLVLNILVVMMEMIAASLSWTRNGINMFMFYTEDSNIFAMIACALYAIFLVRLMIENKQIPKWAVILKYIAACCLSLTFLIVIFVLAPMAGGLEGYRRMLFMDSMLYTHLLCPIVTVLSCIFVDVGDYFDKKMPKYALIPTILYATVAIILNLAGLLTGPYPFLRVYQQPWWASVLWCIGIVGGSYFVNDIVWKFKKIAQ